MYAASKGRHLFASLAIDGSCIKKQKLRGKNRSWSNSGRVTAGVDGVKILRCVWHKLHLVWMATRRLCFVKISMCGMF